MIRLSLPVNSDLAIMLTGDAEFVRCVGGWEWTLSRDEDLMG
jgi:hypothetical protein